MTSLVNTVEVKRMMKNKTDTVIHQLSYVSFCNKITRLGGLLTLPSSLASDSPFVIGFGPVAVENCAKMYCGCGLTLYPLPWLGAHTRGHRANTMR